MTPDRRAIRFKVAGVQAFHQCLCQRVREVGDRACRGQLGGRRHADPQRRPVRGQKPVPSRRGGERGRPGERHGVGEERH